MAVEAVNGDRREEAIMLTPTLRDASTTCQVCIINSVFRLSCKLYEQDQAVQVLIQHC